MADKILSAGDTIDSHCTRCRAIMNHTIIAMVEDRVARVKCNTCGSEHNHKPIKTASSSPPRKKATSSRATKASANASIKEWETLKGSISAEKAIPYSMDGAFRKNDVVNHPVFGLGIVKDLPGAMKMEVLFEAGIKLLRCK